MRCIVLQLVFFFCCISATPNASLAEEPLFDKDLLVSKLRQGGNVLYFRHAHTDWSQNDQVMAVGDWWSCSPDKMRQLSERGRSVAKSIGNAIRKLSIPVGQIYSSEYCRTRQTAEHFGLGEVTPSQAIINLRIAEFFGGHEAAAAQAHNALLMKPPPGTNTIWVAHGNILRAAAGEYPGEAGCVIFSHRNDGTLQVVGRLSPEDWTALAMRHEEEKE